MQSKCCAKAGVDISNLRSQPLTATLVDRATHIFAMTGAHLETIQTLFPQGAEKSFLLREFEEPGTTVWRDVPDPIGLGREVYEQCARIIKNALPSVLAFVEQGELVRPGATRATRAIFSSDGPSSSPHRDRIDRFETSAPLRRRFAQSRSGNFRCDRWPRKNVSAKTSN